MRTFRFNAIWLLSRRDRRARKIILHPRKNLLLGRNHTGKSTVIKNLLLTLGANPKGKLSEWDHTAATAVSFTIDRETLLVVHQSGFRGIFTQNGEIVGAASSHKEWVALFSMATGLNLVLTDKNMETVPADARCFFLPFYINQDGSWQSEWDTFVGLQQYKSPVGAILDYFSGIKPPEYYDTYSKKTQAQHLLADLEKEEVFLVRARERFAKSISAMGPKVDSENFSNEIVRLTHEVNELNGRQEKLRDQAVRERELLSNIRLQISLADDALRVYDKDSLYLREDQPEHLACPTCGAEHSRSFLDVFTYAEDARVLRELVARLHGDATEAVLRCQKTAISLRDLGENYNRVSSILDLRHGELRFGDVVNSMGAESAFSAFEKEASTLKQEINKRRDEIAALLVILKVFSDPKRSKEILTSFRNAYAAALINLNLPPIPTKNLKLASRPDLSGSGGPRSILAYYAALWTVCFGKHGAYSVPLIIDAPQQQGQDDVNLPKILSFIANNLPQNTQIIAGVEVETNETFDRVIELKDPYNLLKADEFDEVSTHLDPLLEAMYNDVRRRSSA
jgi:predicted  nucleic acid-binding Zn-ribbon protein